MEWNLNLSNDEMTREKQIFVSHVAFAGENKNNMRWE